MVLLVPMYCYMRENTNTLNNCYQSFKDLLSNGAKGFAVLVDPDHFNDSDTGSFIRTIPVDTTHIFVGGSKIVNGETEQTVRSLKEHSNLPILLFPGDASQITDEADGILFLSLLSGRNPDYLIGQQVAAIPRLKKTKLDIIPMGYILIDGGSESSVQRVSQTKPMPQDAIQAIVDTALAGEYLGMQIIYLEAGSGAKDPVGPEIIRAVRKEISVPLIVGGGIKNELQRQKAYQAGADLVVMGSAFETKLL
jgi:phosphoglycerol geranylgeranyltransferase